MIYRSGHYAWFVHYHYILLLLTYFTEKGQKRKRKRKQVVGLRIENQLTTNTDRKQSEHYLLRQQGITIFRENTDYLCRHTRYKSIILIVSKKVQRLCTLTTFSSRVDFIG